jgi:hypothetical protein
VSATILTAISDWGVHEAFLLTLLAAGCMGAEQGLLLSVSFGVLCLLAVLPGAIFLAFAAKGAASEAQFANVPSH